MASVSERPEELLPRIEGEKKATAGATSPHVKTVQMEAFAKLEKRYLEALETRDILRARPEGLGRIKYLNTGYQGYKTTKNAILKQLGESQKKEGFGLDKNAIKSFREAMIAQHQLIEWNKVIDKEYETFQKAHKEGNTSLRDQCLKNMNKFREQAEASKIYYVRMKRRFDKLGSKSGVALGEKELSNKGISDEIFLNASKARDVLNKLNEDIDAETAAYEKAQKQPSVSLSFECLKKLVSLREEAEKAKKNYDNLKEQFDSLPSEPGITKPGTLDEIPISANGNQINLALKAQKILMQCNQIFESLDYNKTRYASTKDGKKAMFKEVVMREEMAHGAKQLYDKLRASPGHGKSAAESKQWGAMIDIPVSPLAARLKNEMADPDDIRIIDPKAVPIALSQELTAANGSIKPWGYRGDWDYFGADEKGGNRLWHVEMEELQRRSIASERVSSKVSTETTPYEKFTVSTSSAPTYKNEDSSVVHVITIVDSLNRPIQIPVFAVCDGHGGKEISRLVKQLLPDFLKAALQHDENVFSDNKELRDQAIYNAITDGFIKLNEELRRRWVEAGGTAHVGSTCTGGMIMGNEFWAFNAGDSRTVCTTRDGRHMNLTRDAKASDPDFTPGVKERGGVIERADPYDPKDILRVGGMIAPARGFGDFYVPGMTAYPTITRIPLDQIGPEGCIVMSSDGLWDHTSTEQALDFARGKSAEEISRGLASHARTVWDDEYGDRQGDDCRVIAIKLNPPKKQ